MSVTRQVCPTTPAGSPERTVRGPACALTPLDLAFEAAEPVLALGGELKSTICLLAGRQALISDPFGDLSDPQAFRGFVQTVEQFRHLPGFKPARLACDLHPDYAATRYALRLGLPAIAVQHHHAHMVSAMADAGITGDVIGIACDGTGYGSDGAIWGCEVLACNEREFHRAAHLAYFPLLGGDAAARETWRPAAGLLAQAFGSEWPNAARSAFDRIPQPARGLAVQQLAAPPRWVPKTSSLGRLFDAVAFLLGICERNTHEAQAAMQLEALAGQCPQAQPFEYRVVNKDPDPRGLKSAFGEIRRGEPAALELDVRPMIRQLVLAMQAGREPATLARGFHETIADMLAEAATCAAEQAGLDRFVLSGGCFLNRLLLTGVSDRLRAAGRAVFTHRRVPPGDAGLALGQAVVAAASEWRQS